VSTLADTRALLQRFATLFWDFDGVIKESLAVKSDAFERLFAPFGTEVAARVRAHHESNGGMSRAQKLPLYLNWAGCDCSAGEVSRYGERFSAMVRQAVIDSAWVAGAREYLEANCRRQRFVLVTATPEQEMQDILRSLHARAWFAQIYGSPTEKTQAVLTELARHGDRKSDALMIGDSEPDYAAAQSAGVQFLLRRTTLNQALQRAYSGPQCEDFQ
jgi:HAD superfamily hydrolase (TIGR01549 family)